MARRDKHQLGRALAISVGLHLAVLSLQFGLSGKNWPALGWNWGEREASVPLPSRRVELRAGSVETAVTPSSPLPIQLPVARTTATPDMPHTLIVTLLPPPLPSPVPPPPVLSRPAPQALMHAPVPAPVPVMHKKIRGKKGSPILSVAQASSEDTWFVPPMATGDKTGRKDKEEPPVAPPAVTEPAHTQPPQEVPTPIPSHVAAEAEVQTKRPDPEQEQQILRARERAEQEQRQLAERAEAERIAARALQRQKEEAEARAEAQAEEVRRKAEQEAMAKKAAEEAAKAEAAALRQRAETQAEQERARAIEKARQEQERLRLAAAQMREAEEKRKAMEAERLAEEQRREAEKLAERRKAEALAAAEAQARAEAQAQAQAEAAARAAREAAARYQQEQQSLAAERARAAISNNANANASSAAGKNDAARKGASLATQALNMARRGDDTLPGKAPTDKDNAHLAERPARSSFLGRNPNEIQLSFYGDSWEEKIRRIGNINYPRVPRDSAYGSVVVSVRIRSNGSLESISILKSSGNREIDQATRRIIEMCAPFAAFPPDLRRNFDVIEVRRTLTFPDHPPLFISQ